MVLYINGCIFPSSAGSLNAKIHLYISGFIVLKFYPFAVLLEISYGDCLPS